MKPSESTERFLPHANALEDVERRKVDLLRRVVCSSLLNERCDDASKVLHGCPDSVGAIAEALGHSGFPFELRTLDAQTQVSRTKLIAHFAAFGESLLATLARTSSDAADVQVEDDMLPDVGMGIFGSQLIGGDAEEVIDRRSLTLAVSTDVERALALVCDGKASRNAVLLLTALVLEVIGQSEAPETDDEDLARIERTRKAIQRAQRG